MAAADPITAVVQSNGTDIVITIEGFNGGAGYNYTGANRPTITVSGVGPMSQKLDTSVASETSQVVNGTDLDITCAMAGTIYRNRTVTVSVPASWCEDVGNVLDNNANNSLLATNNSGLVPPTGGHGVFNPFLTMIAGGNSA